MGKNLCHLYKNVCSVLGEDVMISEIQVRLVSIVCHQETRAEDLTRIQLETQTNPNDCLFFVIFYYICGVKQTLLTK